MRPAAARAAGVFALAFAGAAMALAATSYKQPGFSEAVVFTGLTNPTTVRFLPDGRVVVAEKSGLIKLFPNISTNTYTVVADLRTQTHNFWDRGLVGLAVDPDFATNKFIYVLYTFDAPIGGTPPAWGPGDGTSDGCPSPPGATTDGCVVSGRLSRLTAVGTNWTTSEQVLINDWCQQYPSHSVGALDFGADGYLYVSAGDGASFDNADWGNFGGSSGSPTPKNPCGDPPVPVGGNQTPPSAEGGALRSQNPLRGAAEPRILDGSLLRVDPATGAGVPGNPFFSSTDENARRIVAYGLRNPFRITIKPGTNDVWISDVGWRDWEEVNRIPDPTSARNFGWPCYEGAGRQSTYDAANLTLCENLYAAGTAAAPVLAYNHGLRVVANDGCTVGSSSVAGLAFHTGGSNYPASYQGALLFSDYSRSCMWVMFQGAGGDPDPSTIAAFASTAQGPVDIQRGPDGNFYYVDFNGGKILRIEYGLRAVASANPTSGGIPLTVQFDGSASQPAQPGDTLTYAWDLDGDGQFDDSTAIQPSFLYTTAGTYVVKLKVTDQRGASDVSDPVTILADAGIPTATVLTPLPSLTWKVGDIITFSGQGTDPQDGTLPASALSWKVIIHHCPSDCHTHTYQTFDGVAGGSFPAPDHEYPMYLEIQLTVTDADNNTGTASVNINPQTTSLTFVTVPVGLQLSAGTTTGIAPFTAAFIVGSQVALTAAPIQGAYPTIWEFGTWSDGGAPSHTIAAPAAPATFTATYAPHADLSLAMGAPPEACDGDTITYTLTVANAGLSQATAISVVDTPPAGATVVSAGGTGWTCGGTAPVICTLPSLDVTAAPPISIVVTAPAGTAVNFATVGSAITDVNGSNNAASASTNVKLVPALPAIAAANWVPVGAMGVPASVADLAGSTYAWTLSGGTIASGQGTASITFNAGTPGTTMALQVVETNTACSSPAAVAKIQVAFLDVPPLHPFHDFVNTIARNGVTAGCTDGTTYCPDAPNTRAQMAVFLLKSKFGSSHVPPPATGLVFLDVPASDPFAPWIEELFSLGVSTGCGGGNYCPLAPVTRAQMAVFLLKTLEGSTYVPPGATGTIFGDVPTGGFAADWIEDLYNRGITGGCQASPLLYCPDNSNTRGQMAVFLTKTFSLQ